MFNRYISTHAQAGPAYPQTVTVHEHRAATDDSIRLANEMLEKVHRQVVFSETVNDNVFNYTCKIVLSPDNCESILLVHAKINGTDIVAQRRLDDNSRSVKPYEVIKLLMEKLFEVFSMEIAKDLINRNRDHK